MSAGAKVREGQRDKKAFLSVSGADLPGSEDTHTKKSVSISSSLPCTYTHSISINQHTQGPPSCVCLCQRGFLINWSACCLLLGGQLVCLYFFSPAVGGHSLSHCFWVCKYWLKSAGWRHPPRARKGFHDDDKEWSVSPLFFFLLLWWIAPKKKRRKGGIVFFSQGLFFFNYATQSLFSDRERLSLSPQTTGSRWDLANLFVFLQGNGGIISRFLWQPHRCLPFPLTPLVRSSGSGTSLKWLWIEDKLLFVTFLNGC